MNDRNQKGLLLVISGCAGTGKGTVVTKLRERYPDAFAYSVSATTRAPRPGEEDHVHYHFVAREEFEDLILHAEMLEYTEYCGNYYGTPKSELKKTLSGRNLILEIEVEGAANIKRLYPDAVSVFIAPPDLPTLEARLRGRGTSTEEDIQNRMSTALAELARIPDYDYVVVNENDSSALCAEQIYGILCAEKNRVSRSGALIASLTYER